MPPVAEPPHETVVAAELPVALAAEAKALASTIGLAWNVSELKNFPKWALIAAFTKRLAQLGRLAEVTQQFAAYKIAHLRPGIRPHKLENWLGSPADDYQRGEWCGCDWTGVAAQVQARPSYGPILPQATVGTTSSPTRARQAKSW